MLAKIFVQAEIKIFQAKIVFWQAKIFTSKTPSLNQSIFKGVSSFDFARPKIKNTKETIIDHNLMDSLLIRGQKATIKNTIKKSIPKLRFELIFISDFFIITLFLYISYISSFNKFGEPYWIRTNDTFLKREVLYQLS